MSENRQQGRKYTAKKDHRKGKGHNLQDRIDEELLEGIHDQEYYVGVRDEELLEPDEFSVDIDWLIAQSDIPTKLKNDGV